MWIIFPTPMIGHVTRRMRSDRSMWWKCDQTESSSSITQERITKGCSKLVCALNVWSLIYETRQCQEVKGQSHNIALKLSTKTSNVIR